MWVQDLKQIESEEDDPVVKADLRDYIQRHAVVLHRLRATLRNAKLTAKGQMDALIVQQRALLFDTATPNPQLTHRQPKYYLITVL